jgi:hypothetical protein
LKIGNYCPVICGGLRVPVVVFTWPLIKVEDLILAVLAETIVVIYQVHPPPTHQKVAKVHIADSQNICLAESY